MDITAMKSAKYIVEQKLANEKDFFKRNDLKDKLKKIEFDIFKEETNTRKQEEESVANEQRRALAAEQEKQRQEELKNRIRSYI